jgi:hypothetical protein
MRHLYSIPDTAWSPPSIPFDPTLPAIDVPSPIFDAGIFGQPYSVLRDGHSVHPSFEELLDRLRRNFTGHGIPKAEREESLTVELLMDPEQVRDATVLPIGIPVLKKCPVCGGAGRQSFFPCANCDSRGLVEDLQTVEIAIAPELFRGMVFESSLQYLGIQNLYLRAYLSFSHDS